MCTVCCDVALSTFLFWYVDVLVIHDPPPHSTPILPHTQPPKAMQVHKLIVVGSGGAFTVQSNRHLVAILSVSSMGE